jgi:hypothetical protein
MILLLLTLLAMLLLSSILCPLQDYNPPQKEMQRTEIGLTEAKESTVFYEFTYYVGKLSIQ